MTVESAESRPSRRADLNFSILKLCSRSPVCVVSPDAFRLVMSRILSIANQTLFRIFFVHSPSLLPVALPKENETMRQRIVTMIGFRNATLSCLSSNPPSRPSLNHICPNIVNIAAAALNSINAGAHQSNCDGITEDCDAHSRSLLLQPCCDEDSTNLGQNPLVTMPLPVGRDCDSCANESCCSNRAIILVCSDSIDMSFQSLENAVDEK